ncbi:chitin deacetylase [Coprinopsis cinerea okayama7|uniref:chitin deacetylase n=1 Tax=Coprinopsis cinerea (strain Okayama-7 / 130 / ATCC MYA-4618 / FGSC 9003) TaxID=240176 RepID=A8P1T1_COPC7|nr:chitin deacetylase [Coprinopsis cinerea okayama7\|eukprot:XP_001838170.2 chitin deacetylase [Coprinopsis cinerea okayama7\
MSLDVLRVLSLISFLWTFTTFFHYRCSPAIFFSLFLALVVPRGVLAHNPPVNKSSTGAGNSFLENGTPAGDIRDVRYSEKDTDCWWTYSKCVSPKHEGLPNDIADVPESQNQQATMFYIGSNVMDWPLEAQRAVSDDTWSHRYTAGMHSQSSIIMQAIKLVAGVTPTCWRPPFGDVDDRIRAIANGLGLRTILWKYDTNDWRVGMPDPDAISIGQVDANYEALLAEAEKGTFSGSGAILLAHELNNFTMSEAVKYYQKLKSKFQNIVPLAVALNKTQPYVEDDFVLPSFADHISKGIPNASNDDPSRSSFAQATSLPSPVPDVDGFYSASNVDEIHSQDPELEISSMSSPLSLGFLSPASWRFTVFVGVLSVLHRRHWSVVNEVASNDPARRSSPSLPAPGHSRLRIANRQGVGALVPSSGLGAPSLDANCCGLPIRLRRPTSYRLRLRYNVELTPLTLMPASEGKQYLNTLRPGEFYRPAPRRCC